MIEGKSLSESLRQTARTSTSRIYQATVQADGVLIKADVLSRGAQGWELTEVKSATTMKPEYVPDVAVQAHVLRRAGIALSRASLAHIDNSFTYAGDNQYGGLLKSVDVTVEAFGLSGEVATWAERFGAVLNGETPEKDIGAHCGTPVPCEFAAHCDPYIGCSHRADVLPRIGATKLVAWRRRGILELVDVPESEINSQQRMVRTAHLNSTRRVDTELLRPLSELPYPRFYMDFETSNPGVPKFAGMHPYEHFVFQWSCHVQRSSEVLEHREFLALDPSDPRERAVVSLISAVEASGPILVWYASFEKGRLADLARAFPTYAIQLQAIADRIVDIHPLFVRSYYDPGMNGSWSIKAVLPTIDASLDYANLPGIRDGGMAMDAYAEMTDPETAQQRRDELREQLELTANMTRSPWSG